jgi:hypothetical protein
MAITSAQYIATLDAFGLVLEQPLAPGEPTARGSKLPAEEKAVTDPPRQPGRRPLVAPVEACAVRALEGSGVSLVVAEHVRRAREQLEVLWRQRYVAIGSLRRPVCLDPPALREGLAPLLQLGGSAHRR